MNSDNTQSPANSGRLSSIIPPADKTCSTLSAVLPPRASAFYKAGLAAALGITDPEVKQLPATIGLADWAVRTLTIRQELDEKVLRILKYLGPELIPDISRSLEELRSGKEKPSPAILYCWDWRYAGVGGQKSVLELATGGSKDIAAVGASMPIETVLYNLTASSVQTFYRLATRGPK